MRVGPTTQQRVGLSVVEAEHGTSSSLEVVGTGRAQFYDTYDERVQHVESEHSLAPYRVRLGRLGRYQCMLEQTGESAKCRRRGRHHVAHHEWRAGCRWTGGSSHTDG